jgi:hypothetical protein
MKLETIEHDMLDESGKHVIMLEHRAHHRIFPAFSGRPTPVRTQSTFTTKSGDSMRQLPDGTFLIEKTGKIWKAPVKTHEARPVFPNGRVPPSPALECLLSPAADMPPHQVCAAVGQQRKDRPRLNGAGAVAVKMPPINPPKLY